jgi:signal transduction histidine kinase
MKIQTQARLLVASIVVVPLFVIVSQITYRQFLSDDVVSALPVYNDVSTQLEKYISPEQWDSISRNVIRFRQFGDIAIFRNDFLVLYSEIADFSPDVFVSWENILPLMENQRTIFTSIGLEENHGYIFVQIKNQSIKDRLLPFFLHALIGIILIVISAIFGIIMSIIITQNITRSVKVLENATRRIAEGDLDINVEAKGSNEIISLTNSLNKMRDALKEDERRRSRFIMGITHDLKTPLALIKGYAEAIEDGIAEDTASRTNAAEIITAKADQLEDMINDLIDYVRMETGVWRSQLQHVNLSVFLQNLIKQLNMDVELLHHKFIHNTDLPEIISIPLDEKLAIRAFENLIHNAVRHTPNGSIISLEAVQNKNTAEITISDNGPGLDDDDIPRIFEMFYRGSSSRREQGMGLGLAVVKWVVDYHGWSISASSEKGNGTSFTIRIPLS